MKLTEPRIGEIILLALVLAFFGIGIFYYPRLPATTPGHLDGQRQTGLGCYSNILKTFGLSSFVLFVFLLYAILPRLCLRGPNYKFKYYDRLMIWLFTFWLFGQYHGLRSELVMPSLEQEFTQVKILCGIALGSLFLLLGDMCSRLKPSWPIFTNRWIRRNPQVLEQTIKSVGWWLKAAGISSLTLVVLPTYFSIPAAGVCLLVVEFYMFVYPHYARFRKSRRATKQVDTSTGEQRT
ncbi:MAG: hypothetical protein JXN61_11510 [Sedimentisphaerales bacterium]|nr:hypothetical protein [Sedimentisphaerales bacterium]